MTAAAKVWPGLFAGCLLMSAAAARGDGGAVRLSERCGAYRVTVFTSPVPLRAGPVDVSVLVQDDATRRVVADAAVTVRVSPGGRPREATTRAATAGEATNRLLRAALFELPEPGVWDVEVTVAGSRGSATVGFPMDVGEPLPGLPDLAAWVGWPALAVGVYGVHRALVWRRENRSATLRRSVPGTRPPDASAKCL